MRGVASACGVRMSVSTAIVKTASAHDYMVRLCKHWAHKYPVAVSEEKGEIEFPEKRLCSLEAGPQSLTIRLRANDAARLERFQATVVDHLRRFAFREELGAIAWTLETEAGSSEA